MEFDLAVSLRKLLKYPEYLLQQGTYCIHPNFVNSLQYCVRVKDVSTSYVVTPERERERERDFVCLSG